MDWGELGNDGLVCGHNIHVIARSACDEAIHAAASGEMDCFAALAIRIRTAADLTQLSFGFFARIFISRYLAAPPSRLLCGLRSTAIASSGTSLVMTEPEPI